MPYGLLTGRESSLDCESQLSSLAPSVPVGLVDACTLVSVEQKVSNSDSQLNDIVRKPSGTKPVPLFG